MMRMNKVKQNDESFLSNLMTKHEVVARGARGAAERGISTQASRSSQLLRDPTFIRRGAREPSPPPKPWSASSLTQVTTDDKHRRQGFQATKPRILPESLQLSALETMI